MVRAADYGHKGPGFESGPMPKCVHVVESMNAFAVGDFHPKNVGVGVFQPMQKLRSVDDFQSMQK